MRRESGPRRSVIARLGPYWLRADLDVQGALLRIQPLTEPPAFRGGEGTGPVAAEVRTRLEQVLSRPLGPLRLPRGPAPTPFQQRLRTALLAIPPGQVQTYGALARAMGTSARAIGAGCRANPLPVAVPCHRVVSARGFGGFAGAVAGPLHAFKIWLLRHEHQLAHGTPLEME